MGNKSKALETRPNFVDNPEYIETNEKLDKIYQKKKQMVLKFKVNVTGASTEKTLNFFLNLEKFCGVQNQIRNILTDNTEINSQKNINKELYWYYKNLFIERRYLSEHDINNF